MTGRRLLAAIVFLFAAASTFSAQTKQRTWTYFTSAEGEFVEAWQIDKASIKRTGDTVRIWARVVSSPEKTPVATAPTVFEMSLFEYNCKTESSRNLFRIAYYGMLELPDGKQVRAQFKEPRGYSTPDAEFNPVVPDSIDEAFFEFVCRSDKKQ